MTDDLFDLEEETASRPIAPTGADDLFDADPASADPPSPEWHPPTWAYTTWRAGDGGLIRGDFLPDDPDGSPGRFRLIPPLNLQDLLGRRVIRMAPFRIPDPPNVHRPVAGQALRGIDVDWYSYPLVAPHLPADLRAYIAERRPLWAAQIARERALRDARPADPLRAILADPAPDAPPIDPRLWPYQAIGVRWLDAGCGRGIVADEMGLGKTPQALVAIERSRARHAVVFAPASVLVKWGREAARWAPSFQARVVKRLAEVRGPAEGVRTLTIVSWGIVSLQSARRALLAASFDACVADEAHGIKNPEARRTRVASAVAHACDVRILLTGTPVSNRPIEYFPLLHLVDPLRFPVESQWGESFCKRVRRDPKTGRPVTDYRGCRRPTDLVRIATPYVLRRLKADEAQHLPEKRREVLEVPASPAIRAQTRAVLDALRGPRSESGGSPGLAQLQALRRAVGIAKIPYVLEWIASCRMAGEPWVIFVTHPEIAEKIGSLARAEGDRVAVIHGQTRNRQDLVDAFQAGDLDGVVGTEAIREGIELTRASLSLHAEWWLVPALIEQAEDRLHRPGQRRGVLCTTLHLEGSLDDWARALCALKVEMITPSTAREPWVIDALRALRA